MMTLTTKESDDDRTEANQAAVRTSKDYDTDDVDQTVSTRTTCRGDLCFPPSSGPHPTDED
jgi:hypothetical protein